MDNENNKSVSQATASISNLSQGASADADGKSKPSASEGYAWSAWLEENGSRLLLFARQQTRSSEDAEDVFQDALVKLARKIDEGVFDGGQDAWKPYLYTAIRRLSIDLGRKNDRRNRREEKSEADRRGETGGMIGQTIGDNEFAFMQQGATCIHNVGNVAAAFVRIGL